MNPISSRRILGALVLATMCASPAQSSQQDNAGFQHFITRKREEFFTDPQVKEDYKATVRFVLSRVNTVSGVRYKDDKAVLAWQFGNEMHTAPAAWLSEMAAYIQSIDANHLVAETVHIPGKPMTIDPNIDLVTRHLYTSYEGVGGEWPEAMRREMAVLTDQQQLQVHWNGPAELDRVEIYHR